MLLKKSEANVQCLEIFPWEYEYVQSLQLPIWLHPSQWNFMKEIITTTKNSLEAALDSLCFLLKLSELSHITKTH